MKIANKIRTLIKRIFIKERIIPVIIKDIPSCLLKEKNILIAGGNSGIGLSIAKKAIESGGNIIIIGSNSKKCIQVANELLCEYLITDLKDTEKMMIDVSNLLDKKNIDILINCAGIHGTEKFGEISSKQWDDVMDVNVKSLYFLSQLVSNHMINNKIQGHILNISSASSIKPGWTPYEISKRAVNGITLGFAHKLIKHGIIVNGIAPGPTATPMLNFTNQDNIDLSWSANPSGRVSTVEEIANLAIFLISDLGKGIVGDTIFLTGGSGTICMDK